MTFLGAAAAPTVAVLLWVDHWINVIVLAGEKTP